MPVSKKFGLMKNRHETSDAIELDEGVCRSLWEKPFWEVGQNSLYESGHLRSKLSFETHACTIASFKNWGKDICLEVVRWVVSKCHLKKS